MRTHLNAAFVIGFVCIGLWLHADIDSTREVLRQHCGDHPATIQNFDRLATSWRDYQQSHADGWQFDKLLQAVEFAAIAHSGQMRDDAATPYIIHPIGVAANVWDIAQVRSVNVLIAALLHDTLEDTEATEEQVQTLFGSRVLYTVKELTDEAGLPSAVRKQRQVEHAPYMSLDAQLVKLSDRLYNVRDMGNSADHSQEWKDRYMFWAEKLLKALTGTNEALEEALQAEIAGS